MNYLLKIEHLNPPPEAVSDEGQYRRNETDIAKQARVVVGQPPAEAPERGFRIAVPAATAAWRLSMTEWGTEDSIREKCWNVSHVPVSRTSAAGTYDAKYLDPVVKFVQARKLILARAEKPPSCRLKNSAVSCTSVSPLSMQKTAFSFGSPPVSLLATQRIRRGSFIAWAYPRLGNSGTSPVMRMPDCRLPPPQKNALAPQRHRPNRMVARR
jgi:hypothetical protein